MTTNWHCRVVWLGLTALAAPALAGGCNRAAEKQREAEQIAGEFAHSPETDSAGWDAAEGEQGGGEPADLGDSPDAGFDGAAVYKNSRCDMCHGESREGTDYGPPVLRLTELWQRAELEQFLLDPGGSERTDRRLRSLHGEYKVDMPAWDGSGEELAALIDWLLLIPEEER